MRSIDAAEGEKAGRVEEPGGDALGGRGSPALEDGCRRVQARRARPDFLKYVSDIFARRYDEIRELVDDESTDYFMPTDAAKRQVLEDRDEYTSEGVFWIPDGHRWFTGSFGGHSVND